LAFIGESRHGQKMKNTISNSAILFAFWLFLVLGCGGSSSGESSSERVNERGRLSFVASATSIHTNTRSIYRSTSRAFYVDGKEWSPEGEPEFAERFESCDTSPNKNVEVLLCSSGFGETPEATYILRMKNDKPEVKKVEAGNDFTWIDADGRWLLFRKLYYNIETDEQIPVKGMPFADDEYAPSPVTYLSGISPDKKTVVADLGGTPRTETKNGKESTEKFLTLWVIDTETGATEKRKVSFTKHPWLADHEQPHDGFAPPPATIKKYVWKRGANGKDVLVVPELLEKVER
jgi:hypothetical protein